MTVNGEAIIKVHVKPEDVIKGLLEEVLVPKDGYICEENGLFYKGVDGNGRAEDTIDQITENHYKYIRALQLVLQTLKEK